MPYKFGNTYKEDCDTCIDSYMTSRKYNDSKQVDLRKQIQGNQRLTAISYDPHVRDQLNNYRDTNPQKPVLMGELPTVYMCLCWSSPFQSLTRNFIIDQLSDYMAFSDNAATLQ